MKDNPFDIPFQVQNLIESMNNKKDSDHVRGNFRMRLDSIRKVIDQAIEKFDAEMAAETQRDRPRKARR